MTPESLVLPEKKDDMVTTLAEAIAEARALPLFKQLSLYGLQKKYDATKLTKDDVTAIVSAHKKRERRKARNRKYDLA